MNIASNPSITVDERLSSFYHSIAKEMIYKRNGIISRAFQSYHPSMLQDKAHAVAFVETALHYIVNHNDIARRYLAVFANNNYREFEGIAVDFKNLLNKVVNLSLNRVELAKVLSGFNSADNRATGIPCIFNVNDIEDALRKNFAKALEDGKYLEKGDILDSESDINKIVCHSAIIKSSIDIPLFNTTEYEYDCPLFEQVRDRLIQLRNSHRLTKESLTTYFSLFNASLSGYDEVKPYQLKNLINMFFSKLERFFDFLAVEMGMTEEELITYKTNNNLFNHEE